MVNREGYEICVLDRKVERCVFDDFYSRRERERDKRETGRE